MLSQKVPRGKLDGGEGYTRSFKMCMGQGAHFHFCCKTHHDCPNFFLKRNKFYENCMYIWKLISILDVHFIICMVWHVDWCLIWILDVAITKIFRIFFWKCFATVTHETFSPIFISFSQTWSFFEWQLQIQRSQPKYSSMFSLLFS